ncbi:MAG: 2-oxoglutarate dehydrogenase E1 component [Bacteriovoracia bacterium]
MQKFSYLKSGNAEYIDELLEKYLENPESVDASWRYFFDGLELGVETAQQNGHTNGHANGHANGYANGNGTVATTAQAATHGMDLSAEAKVAELIMAYRNLGKLTANLNPINPPLTSHPLLELSAFGLTEGDLGRTFSAGKLLGLGNAPLKDILQHLRQTYSDTMAVEYMHIQDPSTREWLRAKMESSRNREALEPATRKRILKRLTDSETFERFLHTRYVAKKRFSIEGGESLIPALDRMIEVAAELGATNLVMGMAHRGRLNVLTHTFCKSAESILIEFEEAFEDLGSIGDVKYHMGFSADITTAGGKAVHLSLANNPSHLEFVDPIVVGMACAKQAIFNDVEHNQVIPVLIHGEAAFSGQGVVYETLNLAQLKGYASGGTVHIVVDNQVGFTAVAEETRSTPFATDLAKMMDVPIFHVNGDDPEAFWYISRLAIEFRQKFKRDVFINLLCYRKYGHNEGDEPAFTQPVFYAKVKTHPSTRELYAQKLAEAGVTTEAEAKAMVDEVIASLTQAQQNARAAKHKPNVMSYGGKWEKLRPGTDADMFKPVNTAVAPIVLKEISEKINVFPKTFNLHSKLGRFFEARHKAVSEGKGIDWGCAEALAYATLVNEGHPVRLSGQDVQRGTFTHRHSVLHDSVTGELYAPLNRISETQARYRAFNSHLSETGVLGFEYGWSLADPNALVIWEAQFGDFANGAQVIIDQFIASSETKWRRASGLVLLLPHGYEGQGPEHSSARLERFLQLCGQNNLSVCNFTTPAQLFHALRRQMKRDFRKPMVVMTPKSLLRHPLAISNLSEFSGGGFHEVIDDLDLAFPGKSEEVKRVLFCSGKVYYDLWQERQKKELHQTAIVRVEQLYPFPADAILGVLGRYPNAKEIVWVQEEPRNMGAWTFFHGHWSGAFTGTDGGFAEKVRKMPALRYVGREVAAAPAVGSHHLHEEQQHALVAKAFGP